jgi:hypothetical protein
MIVAEKSTGTMRREEPAIVTLICGCKLVPLSQRSQVARKINAGIVTEFLERHSNPDFDPLENVLNFQLTFEGVPSQIHLKVLSWN